MALLSTTQLPCNEADILLAIQAINQDQIESEYRAASTFNVPRTTLRRRRAGIQLRRDCEPKSKKLTKQEEEVIESYILDLDSRGFPPTLCAVRDMADQLLSERGAGQVGVNWARNFVDRTDSIEIRPNRPYNWQRALCEDPDTIQGWFDLVARTKATYGILD
jgi:hypothetical protein